MGPGPGLPFGGGISSSSGLSYADFNPYFFFAWPGFYFAFANGVANFFPGLPPVPSSTPSDRFLKTTNGWDFPYSAPSSKRHSYHYFMSFALSKEQSK